MPPYLAILCWYCVGGTIVLLLLFEDGFVYCAPVADISHQFTPTFHYYLVKMMTLRNIVMMIML